MLFNSVEYLFFFPVVCVFYFLFPQKIRYIWLLLASYFFYMNWNAEYAILILGVTILTWGGGLLLHASTKKLLRQAVLVASIVSCFVLLAYFKYANFLINNLNVVFDIAGWGWKYSAIDVILPVGISFYVFQAVGYVVDVYRGDAPERNPLKYALFVSFFPQLVAGPIELSSNLLKLLTAPSRLEAGNLRSGLVLILFGLWQKIVVADNIALIVDPVFEGYSNFSGAQIAMAVALFAFQIYCDFGGYTNIAIGSARILGVGLMRNFNSPYLATSVGDFWKRWHISLTSWFRDYLYIPLGGNRKGRFRKAVNVLIVFTVSGLWHGAAWHFVLWGLLNGMLMVAEDVWRKYRNARERRGTTSRWVRRLRTFVLVCIAWLVFRAPSMSALQQMICHSIDAPGLRSMFTGSAFSMFGSEKILILIILSISVLMLFDYIQESRGDFVSVLVSQPALVRWAVYLFFVTSIVVYGVYGGDYVQTQFIYFQF